MLRLPCGNGRRRVPVKMVTVHRPLRDRYRRITPPSFAVPVGGCRALHELRNIPVSDSSASHPPTAVDARDRGRLATFSALVCPPKGRWPARLGQKPHGGSAPVRYRWSAAHLRTRVTTVWSGDRPSDGAAPGRSTYVPALQANNCPAPRAMLTSTAHNAGGGSRGG